MKIGYIRISTTEQNTARQKEGIAIAKENGIYKGRKPIIRTEFETVVKIWKAGEITATEAMKKLNLKPSTFYRKVKKYENLTH